MADTKYVIEPWWERSKAPWYGTIFRRFILQANDVEERRVQRLRKELLHKYNDGRRRISMRAAKLATDAYKSTEGEHPAIRRAKALKHIFENIPIPISSHQLIVGTPASAFHTVEIQPEFLPYDSDDHLGSHISGQWISSQYIFPEEEQEIFKDEIVPYWKDRSRSTYLRKELQVHYPDVWLYIKKADCYTAALGGALYHTIQDYLTILQCGLNTVKEQLESRIDDIDVSRAKSIWDYERLNHFRAMIIAADAMVVYAGRCAEKVEVMAKKERNPERRNELLEMARICRKVPNEPADNWWEALQSWHFLHMGTGLAEGGNSHSAGRFDQYMYPFLLQDLENGLINQKNAQELLECFFLKWNETQTSLSDDTTQGVGNNDKLTIGGIDVHGNDMTNSLSYMCLEAHAHVHMNDPNISVRVHKNTPDDFLSSVLEVIRLGSGLPIIINDEAIVPSLVANGVSLPEARNYADCGCQENLTDPNTSRGADTHGHTNAGWFNLVKPIELALFNGVNPVNKTQVGPKTGNPQSFVTMDDFTNAVKRQFEYAVRTNVILNNLIEYSFARYYPCVFHNLMHPGPRNSGVTINAGGCKYNWTGSLAIGTANAGDIMSAIDYLIYQNQEVSWETLLKALEHDWKSKDRLREKCISAPKYGTDNEWADTHVRNLLAIYFDTFSGHSTPRGGRFVCGLITMSANEVMGKTTGATPDGRKRGEPLADSTAPSRYAKYDNPIVVHRSAARAIDSHRTVNGVTFNQRMNYSLVSTERDVSKWSDMLRTYIEMEGVQVQYSIADKQALLDAQKNPDLHRDMIVRIGGYSAFFIDLSKDLQDSIIASFLG